MPQSTKRAGAARGYALSLILPLLVVVLALLALHVTPFGDHSLAISDGKYYLNGDLFLARILRGEQSPFYSFENGLGGNEWSILAWGGINLPSFLSVFATLETMPSVFTWICALNIALCGPALYALLAHVRGHEASNLVFSTSYALMGFNVVYCYHALFFVGPQLLPLAVLGVLRLLEGRSPLFLTLTLAACTFLNFYFGYMLYVACAAVFAASLAAREGMARPERVRLCLRFAGSLAAAGLIAAPMWLPALKAYSGGGRLDQTGIEEFAFRETAPLLRMASKLFTGASSTSEQVSGMPNVYVGMVPTALAALYLCDSGVARRRKAAAGAVLALYLLSFWVSPLNMAMHGFTHTNWFPFRYSFAFSFLLVMLAAEEWPRLMAVPYRDVRRCAAGLLVAALLVFATGYDFVAAPIALLDFGLAGLAWLAVWLRRERPERAQGRLVPAFALLLCCVGLYANFALSIGALREWELDLGEYARNAMVSGAAVDAVKLSDSSFYRMEKEVSESYTVGADPYLYGYDGVSHSGPAERMFVHKQLNRLGVNWFDMRHWYSSGVSAATDALLGVKYLLSPSDLAAEKGYEAKASIEDELTVYQSPYALGIASLVGLGAHGVELGPDALANLNACWSAMSGLDEPVFVPEEEVSYRLLPATGDREVGPERVHEVASLLSSAGEGASAAGADGAGSAAASGEGSGSPSTPSSIEFRFTARRTGPVYAFNTGVPDTDSGSPNPSGTYAGWATEGEEFVGTLPVAAEYLTQDQFEGGCALMSVAYADLEALAEQSEAVRSRPVTCEKGPDTHVYGTFEASEGQRLLLTIPWDEGWRCYVDGQEVPIDRTWGLFMSVAVPAGAHSYELRFAPAWLDYGLWAAAGGLALLVAMLVGHRLSGRRRAAGLATGEAAPEGGAPGRPDGEGSVLEEGASQDMERPTAGAADGSHGGGDAPAAGRGDAPAAGDSDEEEGDGR